MAISIRSRILVAAVAASAAASCGTEGSSDSTGGAGQSGAGHGGAADSGGTTGNGGGATATGLGGSVDTAGGAGETGSAGAPASGGSNPGSGGSNPGSGGSDPGSGGTNPGSGGEPGSGGDPGSGGEPGSGGDPGSGGESGSGGDPGSGGSNPGTGGGCPVDECPMPSGLVYDCKQRFALGINYAWHTFAGDFGGIPDWSQGGVSDAQATYSAELGQMATNGVSVVRWWMFPDFRGAGVEFDSSDNPSGISSAARDDILTALDLAEVNDLHLVLTIFSFDNFRPDRTDNGIFVRGMSPMVSNASRRATLVNNVVRPVAQAAALSSNAHRLLGWDVINEPEWAVSPTGSAPGNQDFTPNTELEPVTLADMKALINESMAVLHQETPDALVSVGWAAAKWAWAFSDVNVDFHQPHIYGWVNEYWPYTLAPGDLGYGSKPIVMGEFSLAQMPFDTNDTFGQVLNSWWDNGYAGAWPWQFAEQSGNLSLINSFADDKGCPAGF